MGLTSEQIRAIEENGQNIIVSAGAGSGKTRVLSERVFDRISNEKYKWNIDEMLVLTFTNAAAINMKVRIRNRLQLNEGNRLTEEERRTQLNKIDSSFIMTFDAYAQFLVKKYHQILNIDKNIQIVDSNIIKIKTKEIVDEIMLEAYKEKKENFINLIKNFCVKDDNEIRERIIDINNKLNTIYERDKYVKDYACNFYSEESIDKDFKEYTKLLKEKVNSINNKLNELSKEDVDVYAVYPNIENLLTSETYEDIKNNSEIKIGRLKNGSSELAKAIKEEIKDLLDDLKSLTSSSKDRLKEEIINTKENTLCYLELVEKLNERLSVFKKENNFYEFSDVFAMAIKLVDENEEIRNEIKYQFKEILIDEYQDTNDLQDEFISRISNNNVYMVGDIKQSIYHFRNANPKLFQDKYEAYKNGNGGLKLDLTQNFRSREEVLNGVNDVFNRVMDSKIGGADYTKGHTMLAGNIAYKTEGLGKLINQKADTEILNYQYDKDTKNLYPFDTLNQHEVEAFIIAKDIKDKIESKYQVTYLNKEKDENGNEVEVVRLRDAEYKDFTILVDRRTNFDLFKQILTYMNIPSDIQTEEKIDESDLMTVIRSIFKLIACNTQGDYGYDFKYSFMSLARSFVYEMSDSDLYDIVTNVKFFETEMYEKIKRISYLIEQKTITEVLDEIINEFDIYTKLSKIANVSENIIRIEYLYSLAQSLAELGYNFTSFNDYLVNVFETNENDTITYKTQKDNQNAVVITNIHQSKGLEYPICYYPLLTVDFNKQDIKDKVVFSKEAGLVLPTFVENKGLKQTIRKELFKKEYQKNDIGEKIRLFYVALTRAKEKMIFVCPLVDKTKDGTVISDDERLKINNFADILNMVYGDVKKYIKDIDFNDYKNILSRDYLLKTIDIFKTIKDTNEKIEIKPQKIIEPIEIGSSSFSKKTLILDEETINKMEFGTKLHYYLETLDFNNPNYEAIDSKYRFYIRKFLESDLMKNVSQGKAYKEYEFIYEDNKEKKHGFIDLLMEYDDRFDIIDYKTKNIDDELYDQQLNGYRKYIESISDKKVNCYLYSLIDSSLREVNK